MDLRKSALLAGAAHPPLPLPTLSHSHSLGPVEEGISPMASPHSLGAGANVGATPQQGSMFAAPPAPVRKPAITAASWSKYWAEKQMVELPDRCAARIGHLLGCMLRNAVIC